MDIKEFVNNMAEQFYDTDASEFAPDTESGTKYGAIGCQWADKGMRLAGFCKNNKNCYQFSAKNGKF